MATRLKNQIMRRIYYAYAIRTVGDPTILKGFVMLVLMIALTYFVSLGNVLNNMLEIRVGDLHRYVFNAFVNTEAWTLLILGVLIMIAFSFRPSVRSRHEEQHTPHFSRV